MLEDLVGGGAMNAARTVARVFAPVAGALVGFFGTLVSIFGDAGSSERVSTIIGVAVVYGLIAFVCGALDRGRWTIALYVWLPGLVLVAAYLALGEWGAWPWAAFVLALTLGASVTGALAGIGAGSRLARGEQHD